MAVILICDHHRQFFTQAFRTRQDLLLEFKCKRCVKFNMKSEKWIFGDVRFYDATLEDMKVLTNGEEAPKRKRQQLDQLDWVTESGIAIAGGKPTT